MKSKVLALILMWVSIFAFSQITQNEIPEKKSDLTSGWEKNQLFTNQKGLTNNKPDSVNIQYINGTDRNIPGSNPAALMKNPMDQSDNSMPAESQCQSNNQQFITSPAGWSGFSSFVIPGELSVEELFSPYSDQLIILYNLLGTYFPSQQVNTIGNWDPSSGYIAKFSEETNIDFSGQIIQNRRIELVSGWNLIPVLSTCPADVAVLFQNKNVRLVKEVSGYRLYWPEMAINTLDELIPGSAYYVLMNGPGQILFPNCGSQIWQCGDNLVDERDGQSYNTVQIGTQCWMAENLNIGAMIPATQAQSDNSVFEKYCYNGTQDSCNVYGGLYQWDEMMQYDTIAGRRGICPSGWHLPTDEEWKVLEGIADSQFGYPDAEWNSTGFRGYDAGKNLKSENRWLQNGFGVDLFGFNVLPGGNVSNEGLYDNLGAWADFWTSNRLPYGGVSRDLGFSSDESWRDFVPTSYAFSVRCIQNTEPLPWSCGDPMIDTRDNQSYKTVQIGDQCWMAENLNVGVQVNPFVQSDNGIIEKLCYNNDPQNCIESGGLYEWSEIMNYTTTESSQGICPDGWHIPAEAEWDELIMSQGGAAVAGGKLKEAGFGHWDEPNSGATNESGFTALGGGLFAFDYYDGLRQWCGYWTSSKLSVEPINHFLYYLSEEVSFYSWELQNHPNFHLRCIKDIEQSAWSCGDPLLDTRDNQSYNTVQIGTQCWMAENLNTGTMTAPYEESDNGIIEKLCYEDNSANCDEYGGLYFWEEMMEYSTNEFIQGICPAGWRIPSASDWDTLILSQGGAGIAGGNLKETGFDHWDSPNTGATNQSGFTALGGGLYYWGYFGLKQMGYFWTSSFFLNYGFNPQYRVLFHNNKQVSLNYSDPEVHQYSSVRCIKSQCPEIITANAGNDQINVPGNSTILEANAPSHAVESGKWSVLQGTDGSFYDDTDPHSSFSGNPGATYSLAWTISNLCEKSTTDTILISFAPAPVSFCGDVTEFTYEGQVYHTVQIGDQCWLKENLNVGQMIDGSIMQSDNGILEKHCFNNEPDSCTEYGGIYQWDELMQYSLQQNNQGICPEGWRIPTDFDWCMLGGFLDPMVNCNDPEDTYSDMAGGKLKETGYQHWNIPNEGATNESGFTARGGGFSYGYDFVIFNNIREKGLFSTTTRLNENLIRIISLTANQTTLSKGIIDTNYGISVRCIKESEPPVWGCGDPLLDTRDNQSYNTVQIGTQCWMAENLNTGTMTNPYEQSNNGIIEKLCYGNNSSNCDEYGGLYEWNEMMQYSTSEFNQGICPDGWRVPSLSEMDVLVSKLGGESIAGGRLKEPGYIHWNSPNTGATNESGFSAFGAGYFSDGYYGLQQFGSSWTSTMYGGAIPVFKQLTHNSGSIITVPAEPEWYLYISLRCIKSQCPVITTANAGADQLNVAGNSTILDANQPPNLEELGGLDHRCW